MANILINPSWSEFSRCGTVNRLKYYIICDCLIFSNARLFCVLTDKTHIMNLLWCSYRNKVAKQSLEPRDDTSQNDLIRLVLLNDNVPGGSLYRLKTHCVFYLCRLKIIILHVWPFTTKWSRLLFKSTYQYLFRVSFIVYTTHSNRNTIGIAYGFS